MYAGWGETFIGFLRAFSCTKVTYLSEVFHARNNDKVPGNLYTYLSTQKQQKIGVDEFPFPKMGDSSVFREVNSVILSLSDARTWKVSCLIISP